MKILVLSPYPPYPPHGGGTMRVFQIVRGLAKRHTVTCLTFAPDGAAEQALLPLHDICRVVTVRGPEPRGTLRRGWTTLTSSLPDMALRNQSAAYTAALRSLLASERFDIVQAESIEMAPYLEVLSEEYRAQSHKAQHSALSTQHSMLVLDQFNAEYVLQKRAAQTAFAALRAGALTPRNAAGAIYSLAQWIKLARYERRAMALCDLVLAVSDEDRNTLLKLQPHAMIGVVPNGVDSDLFSRGALARERAGAISFAGPSLVFSGTLDFRPNIDAVVWFVEQVLPRIRAIRPDARLLVVGRRPAPQVRALASEAVTIVGEVPDARPFIAWASVYVVPMRIGGGVRLKLLEALALEAPVVTTGMGAEGVAGLRGGEHCLVVDEPEAFADAVLGLIDTPELGAELGVAGRALVREHYDWRVVIPRLDALYKEASRTVQ